MSTIDIVRGRYPDKPTASDHAEVARQLLLSLSGSNDAPSITTTRATMNDYLLMAINEGRELQKKVQDHANQAHIRRRLLIAKRSRQLFVIVSLTWTLICIFYQVDQTTYRGYGLRDEAVPLDAATAVLRGVFLGLVPPLIVLGFARAWAWASRTEK